MALPFPPHGLYAVTPEIEVETLIHRVMQVLEGGASVIQLRDKKKRLDLNDARRLLSLSHRYGAPLIINDDVALACETGADGVHLGRDDAGLEEARRELGDDTIIGVSCYADLDCAREAEARGANYVAFGAFFPSASKPCAPPAPIEILTQARSALSCPIVAIGGITPENGGTLIQAGADLLAVIAGVFDQADPLEKSDLFRQLFSGMNGH